MDKRYRFRLNDLPSSAEYACRHGLDNDWPVGPFHMHPHYEFYLLISGNVQMRVEDESYDAHPMDLFAFPPGVLHRAMLLDHSVPYVSHAADPGKRDEPGQLFLSRGR